MDCDGFTANCFRNLSIRFLRVTEAPVHFDERLGISLVLIHHHAVEVLVNVVGGVRDHIGSDDRFHGTEKGKALDHALSQLHLVAALSGKRENGHLLRLVPVVAEDNIREQTMTHNLPSTAN